MAISHRAFLDLEHGLTQRGVAGWRRSWRPLRRELQSALVAQNWHSADQLVDSLDTQHLITYAAPYAQTVGLSALLLGASRLVTLPHSQIVHNPPLRQLRNAVTQWGFQVSRNTPQLLRRKLHRGLAALEHAAEQRRHQIQKSAALDDISELLDQTESDGEQAMGVAANLLVSRLNSFGFLTEAQDLGVLEYQVSEVLDDHICPVCEEMHGQVFSVAAGLAHASALVDAEDPDSLSTLAPWPSQSKASVAELADADSQDLLDMGLALPPYHPGCRGIVTVVENARSGESAAQAEQAAEGLDVPLVSSTALAALLGIAAGALTPAAQHRGQDLAGEVLDEGLSEEGEDDEAEDAAQEAADQQARQAKKKPAEGT